MKGQYGNQDSFAEEQEGKSFFSNNEIIKSVGQPDKNQNKKTGKPAVFKGSDSYTQIDVTRRRLRSSSPSLKQQNSRSSSL